MEKKILNEEMSRIKNMMGKIMKEQFDDFDTKVQPEELPQEPEHVNVGPDESDLDDTILELRMFASRINHIAEDFRDTFSKTPYWHYLYKVEDAIRTIGNFEGSTRSDERQYNIINAIRTIESDFAPSEDEYGDLPDFDNTNNTENQ